MSKKPTKAELEDTNRRLRGSLATAAIALQFMATGKPADWQHTVTWRDGFWAGDKRGPKVAVRMRAYGLTRADGGVLVSVWRFSDDPKHPHVEVSYITDACSPEARKDAITLGRHAFADALGTLYSATIKANMA